MSEANKIEQSHLNELLANAIDQTDNKLTYVNVVRFHLGINEVTLDLYFLGANPTTPNESSQAQRMARVIMPLGTAKELSQLLLNGISQWEDTFGIALPLVKDDNVDKPVKRKKG